MRPFGRRFPRCVLFDLDGTLLDSAPDMAATIDRMRAARGMAPMPLADLRQHVSKGARAMSAAAFPHLGGEVPPGMVQEFLAVYAGELGRHGAPFEGIEAMLDALEADGARWDIVTNKPERLARALMPGLGWEARCGVLVGGDSLAERKPHPLPLLHAAEAMGFAIADCVYVGDDERDILAARAAGMRSLVALWGYRLQQDDPLSWQADAMARHPADLLDPDAWP
ncbi:MAG: phosphoglycolate phosphatase [Gammaproteobacteria bacterium]|nr:phosphoglycolate phosphatase [Gammaproteobacteria bacterium]